MKRLLFVLYLFTGAELSAQHIIAKLKEDYLPFIQSGNLVHPRLTPLLAALHVSKTTPLLSSYKKSRFLNGILEIHLKDTTYRKTVIASLLQSGYFQYVEPTADKRNKLLHIPSDPFADPVTGSQDYLARIHAYEGWDISKGDTNSFICFIDNGVEWTHPEFQHKIHYNTADPIDSIDNDNDGYVDNYMGWDFVTNDPFPEDSTGDSGHGTEVAGVATARTNNGLGIASVGYNTKMVPIKIFGNNSISTYAQYRSIMYAADRGCKVINLSWGSTGGSYQYEQDIINYAALEKDAVLVGATYPTEGENIFTTPADYDNVISALALYIDDTKSYPQSYHHWIDMSVPGINILTTGLNGGYAYPSGISVGVPMISATASLARGKYPWMNSAQIAELLRVTGDDIDTVKTNVQFKEKLGHGKLNVYRALRDTTTPAIRIPEYTLIQLNKDTFSLQLGFKNYLWPTQQLQLAFRSTDSSAFEVVDSTAYVGKVGMLDSSFTLLGDIRFRVLPYASDEAYALVRIGIEDTSLHYKDYFYFYINKDDYIPAIVTELPEQDSETPFHVFPNPTKDMIFMETNNLEEASIQDLLGHTVAETKTLDGGIASLDLRNQPQGVYVARIRTKSKTYTYKFLKE